MQMDNHYLYSDFDATCKKSYGYRKKRKIISKISLFKDDEIDGFEFFQGDKQSDDEEFIYLESKDSQCIYENSALSVKDFFFQFGELKLRLNLNEKASSEVLKFISSILPKPNKIKSHYSKFIQTDSHKVQQHQFCIKCNQNNTINYKYATKIHSKCPKCQSEFKSFFSFDIKSQISDILNNKHLYQQIQNSNQSQSSKPEDIYLSNAIHGAIYQEALKKKKKKLMISLNINSDGAPINHATNYCLWPIIATIVELEQSTRESFDNMIIIGKYIFQLFKFYMEISNDNLFISGVWLDKLKPNYQQFFDKCLEGLIQIINSDDQEIYQLRVQSLIVDMPAKAAIINIKQFNGEYGCPACFEPGEYIKNLHKRIYRNTTVIISELYYMNL